MPRVLIVDDHAVIRRGVQGILSMYPEWDLCGERTTAMMRYAWPASCIPKW